MKKVGTLLKHEFRLLWIILVLGIIFVMGFSEVIWDRSILGGGIGSIINSELAGGISSCYSSFVLMGIVLLVAFQFSDIRNNGNARNFLSALPVKRKTAFLIKVAAGVSAITLFVLILLGGVGISHARNFDNIMKMAATSPYFTEIYNNERFSVILLQVLLLYLNILAFYLLLVLMQTLVYQSGLAAILGGLAMVFPFTVVRTWRDIFGWATGHIPDGIDKIEHMLKVLFQTGRFEVDSLDGGDLVGDIVVVSCDMFLEKVVFLLILIVIFFAGAYFAWTKQDEAKTSVLMPYRWTRIAFFVCTMVGAVSLSISFLISCSERERFVILPVCIIVVGIVGFLQWYLLLRKKGGKKA